ncbi:Retinol dehydrogenase 7 [Bulinus truncatus]|nr:Retinol dehydrogenase 7 [Bulinus truncatus]
MDSTHGWVSSVKDRHIHTNDTVNAMIYGWLYAIFQLGGVFGLNHMRVIVRLKFFKDHWWIGNNFIEEETSLHKDLQNADITCFIDHLVHKRYKLYRKCFGFGQGLASHLDKLGFHVFAGCLTDEGRTYLKERCSGRLVTILLDVSKNQSIEAALQEVKRSLPEGKGLWGLVNNAGIPGNIGIIEVSTREDYHRVFDVNLLGVVEMTRHFLPLIRKAKGRVVNMSSVAGRIAANGGPYALSKFGVEAYSDILRRELFHRGVKVCIIEPGGFNTPIIDIDRFRSAAGRLFDERATEEMRECYGDMQAVYAKLYSAKIYINPDITPVVDAYTHALTSRFPKTRYTVGLDAKLIYLPLSYLPTWVSDRILALPYVKNSQGKHET